MKSICLYFQIHQPLRLKKYRFFNMGKDVNYLDDFLNKSVMVRTSSLCYIPMNNLLLKLIEQYKGKFRVSFSITGTAIEQLKMYAPEALESFKTLAKTGCVEFLCETYSHSLASIRDKEEFKEQVERHKKLIEEEFGQAPASFRNTELIYSDSIGETVAEMGFNAMVTEGAKHILGWKSPNYLYTNAINPRLKLLLRNARLSDDLRYRFGDTTWDMWPLSAETYVSWIEDFSAKDSGDVANIFLDYETFGVHQAKESGIFEFFEHFVKFAIDNENLKFDTPANIVKEFQPVAVLHVPHPISWTDEERDVTAWTGNEMQNEALDKLYSRRDKVKTLNNPDFNHVWDFMQTSNHFYYISTKWFSDGSTGNVNPYGSPYEAFINYMNVLSDFLRNVDNATEHHAH